MKPSNEQWKEIEGRLKSLWTPVALRCDGYEVTLSLRRIDQFKNAIVVYVDGYFKGVWLTGDSEEGRRFYPTRTRRVYSKEKMQKLIKIFGKREAAKKFDLDKVIAMKFPYWTSFGALKRHFIKYNTDIEWIDREFVAHVTEVEEAK